MLSKQTSPNTKQALRCFIDHTDRHLCHWISIHGINKNSPYLEGFLNRFFSWKNIEPPTKENTNFLMSLNEFYRFFIVNCTLYVHIISIVLIFCCLHFYVRDYTRRNDLRRRRLEIRREHERIPPRRRPGAVHRDHEIFRHILKKVRGYISQADGINNGPIADEQAENSTQ